MSDLTSLDVMRYHDGELDADAAARVERALEGSAEARGSLDALEQIGDFVRAASDVDERLAPDLADRVMERVERAPALRAVGGGESAASAKRSQRAVVWLGGLAAAAGALLALRATLVTPPPELTVHASASATGQIEAPIPAQPSAESALAVADVDMAGPAIESVDFGANTGSIFLLEADSQVTPVVWLVDDAPESGDRMEPL